MVKKRLIPCLQLLDNNLVKTTNFKNPKYIGDFKNTVRIFNELEVDELVIQAIRLKKKKNDINFGLLENITNECFMPLAYGGGIDSFADAKKLFSIGFEKIIISTSLFENQTEIEKVIDHFGSQSVVGTIEVGRSWLGKKSVFSNGGRINRKLSPVEYATKLENLGVGEIIINSILRDGTWSGLDTETINELSNVCNLPIIALGGIGSIEHIKEGIENTDAQAIGIGSKVVYQKKGMGVLINFPNYTI